MNHLSAVGERYDESARARVVLFRRAAATIERRGYKPHEHDPGTAVTLDKALAISCASFDDPARARRDGGFLAMSRFVNVYPTLMSWHTWTHMLDTATAAAFFAEIADLVEQDARPTHTQGEQS